LTTDILGSRNASSTPKARAAGVARQKAPPALPAGMSVRIRQSIGGNNLHDLVLDRWGYDEADGLDGIVRDVVRKKGARSGAYRTMA
jgi:hypothetical protein